MPSRPLLKKHCCSESNLENRLDALPDDVLISIISYFDLKEVARTSVLSRRWRYLWTHTTGTLNFVESIPRCVTRHPKLIDCVNLVLNSHKGPTLDEFKVCFGISSDSSDMINRWIKFAFERRAKRLLLDFRHYESSAPYAKFAVTAHLFTYCPLSSLTSLHLKNVDMTGNVARLILSRFPLLQVLDLHSLSSLENLEVVSASTSLRCLKIKDCLSLRRLEVDADNLVSFAYRGPKIRKFFKAVPRLVEASINKVFLFENIYNFSSYFSRLESLTLDLREWDTESNWVNFCFQIYLVPSRLPKLVKLKRLKVSCSSSRLERYSDLCAHLLNASPFLHIIVLKIYSITGNEDSDNIIIPRKRMFSHPHRHLKVMELRGFRGYTKDAELALRLSATLSSLGTLVIDPYPLSLSDQWDIEKAVTRARRLETFLRKGVKLEIASSNQL